MNNFPFIKQNDAMECGVACLAMVCNFLEQNIFIKFALQPQKESPDLVLMKQLYNLDYELSAEESVLINFRRLITPVSSTGIKIILQYCTRTRREIHSTLLILLRDLLNTISKNLRSTGKAHNRTVRKRVSLCSQNQHLHFMKRRWTKNLKKNERLSSSLVTLSNIVSISVRSYWAAHGKFSATHSLRQADRQKDGLKYIDN